MCVPAWRVVHDILEPKGRESSSLRQPPPPTFCPLRGNKVHANRSDELKSELHLDILPKHTPAQQSPADLVGGPGASLSVRPIFTLLHLCIVLAPRYAKIRAH